jgi:preprotein translocase subunit SecF
MIIFKKEPNFKFMNKWLYAFIGSGLFILIGLYLFLTHGFNLGVEFSGGTNIEISFKEETTVKNLRASLSKVGLAESTIQRVGEQKNKFFIKTPGTLVPVKSTGQETGKEKTAEDSGDAVTKLIEKALSTGAEEIAPTNKTDLNNISETEIANLLVSNGVPRDTAEETAAKVFAFKSRSDNPKTGLIGTYAEIEQLDLKKQALNVLKEKTYLGAFTFLSVESVGPQVGQDLRQKAVLATIWALIGMLIYIAFRFKFIYGVAAVITLVHDVLATLTFVLIFNIEVSLSVVAAILTLVGYSLNDTIVIFDRVRDNLKIMKRQDAVTLLDASINQTLSRTIMTSLATLLTVAALFFFGGEVIYAFSFTLLVGIVLGSYSTIYQSCAWLKIWEKRFLGRKNK